MHNVYRYELIAKQEMDMIPVGQQRLSQGRRMRVCITIYDINALSQWCTIGVLGYRPRKPRNEGIRDKGARTHHDKKQTLGKYNFNTFLLSI